jgi:hypothetical protein
MAATVSPEATFRHGILPEFVILFTVSVFYRPT